MDETLRLIQQADPDGWTNQPTESDYRLFKAWVLSTWGQEVWDKYHTNWEKKEV